MQTGRRGDAQPHAGLPSSPAQLKQPCQVGRLGLRLGVLVRHQRPVNPIDHTAPCYGGGDASKIAGDGCSGYRAAQRYHHGTLGVSWPRSGSRTPVALVPTGVLRTGPLILARSGSPGTIYQPEFDSYSGQAPDQAQSITPHLCLTPIRP